ncbi:MAG TPA: hemophore-related protein [Mycobacterium sp.]|nr:hemophore-related protein [Mycobacterium sp.]
MKMSETTVRRGLYGMFAGGLLAFGSAAIIAPVANAEPGAADTNTCSVSAIANTSSTVSASTSTYLASNPEANEALSEITTRPQEQATEAFRTYFAQNPEVEAQLQTINQPVVDLASQCGIEVTPTPISEALSDV